jgi:hypothetical protein
MLGGLSKRRAAGRAYDDLRGTRRRVDRLARTPRLVHGSAGDDRFLERHRGWNELEVERSLAHRMLHAIRAAAAATV